MLTLLAQFCNLSHSLREINSCFITGDAMHSCHDCLLSAFKFPWNDHKNRNCWCISSNPYVHYRKQNVIEFNLNSTFINWINIMRKIYNLWFQRMGKICKTWYWAIMIIKEAIDNSISVHMATLQSLQIMQTNKSFIL